MNDFTGNELASGDFIITPTAIHTTLREFRYGIVVEPNVGQGFSSIITDDGKWSLVNPAKSAIKLLGAWGQVPPDVKVHLAVLYADYKHGMMNTPQIPQGGSHEQSGIHKQ